METTIASSAPAAARITLEPVQFGAATGGALATEMGGSIDRQRRTVVRRLVDLLFLPSGHLSRHERTLVDETISSLYPRLGASERSRLARRVQDLSDPPVRTALLMARETIEIARPFLDRAELFGQDELIFIVAQTSADHHCAIAARANLQPPVVDALIGTGDAAVLATLLNNHALSLTRQSLLRAVDACRRDERAQALLLTRPDVPADIAHLMFWWVSSEWRHYILQRYAVDRRRIADAVADVREIPEYDAADIALAVRTIGTLRRAPAREGPDVRDLMIRWLADPGAPAIKAALMDVLALHPETLARISADDGGEPMVVLAKAMGLTGTEFAGVEPELWRTLGLNDAERRAALRQLFESISTDWADLVLRVWDRQATTSSLSALASEPLI